MRDRFYSIIFALLTLMTTYGNDVVAQVDVTPSNQSPFTPVNLIQNVFLGQGVEVLNINFNGEPVSVGYFTGGQNVIGIEKGIVMTTGAAVGAMGPNDSPGNTTPNNQSNGSNATDVDLSAIATGGLNDVAVYTITFIPYNDTLRFNYVFASEEYLEYACSDFNDVFGFFLSGPGINGPFQNNAKNIAIVPGTTNTPVSITNVHGSTSDCSGVNAQYYNNNNGNNANLQFDGYTDVFTAEAIVIPCQVYTIKLCISDVTDPILDTGVFLEAKSFGTGPLLVQANTVSLDGILVENCVSGSFSFSVDQPLSSPKSFTYNIIGTAQNGVDYQTIPTQLTIAAGDSTVSMPVIAFEDGITEGIESIGIDIQTDPCNRDTIWLYLKDNSIVPPELPAFVQICSGDSTQVDATLPLPLPVAPSFTNQNDYPIQNLNGLPDPPPVPVNSTINVFGVQPVFLQEGVIQSVCFNIQHLWDDDLDITLISPSGQFLILSSDNGGNGKNYFNTCFKPDATTLIDPTPGIAGAPSSWAPFTGDYLPETNFVDLWDDGDNLVNGTWTLNVLDDQNGFNGTLLDWTITFNPIYKLKYAWSPTNGLSCSNCPNPKMSPAVSTNYIVTVTDTYGCEVYDSVYVQVNTALQAPNVSCSDISLSSITFNWGAILGATSYEVSLDNGATWISPNINSLSHQVTGLPLGSNVTIQVRGIGDCPGAIGTAQCSTPDCISATLDVLQLDGVRCYGEDNASVTLQATGTIAPYTFSLGQESNQTGIFTNLSAGDYIVTVVDGANCAGQFPLTIPEPELIVLSPRTDSIPCFNGNDGKATVTLTGGVYPFTFQWSNTSTDSVAINLPFGTYSVTVTDTKGCSQDTSMTVYQYDALNVQVAVIQNVSCFGLSDAKASITATGGHPMYTYSWPDGVNTSQSHDALSVGTYVITVTDANGCFSTKSFTVTEPTPISIAMLSDLTSCYNSADGKAYANIQGGLAPYNYNWSNNTQLDTLTAMRGTYSVTVSDVNGCTISASIDINAPDSISSTAIIDNVICNGGSTGSITISTTGGVGNYEYLWSNNTIDATNNNLAVGEYFVTILDANNCFVKDSFIITEPAAWNISANTQNLICFGNNIGAIDISVTGNTAPYSYQWSSTLGYTSTSDDIFNLQADMYTITVTDDNSCTTTASYTISQPDELLVQYTSTDVRCKGGDDGSIAIEVVGGTPGYNFHWVGPNSFDSNSEDISALLAGDYHLTISDQNACEHIQNITLSQPSDGIYTTTTPIDNICFGATNGQLQSSPQGGTPPYHFMWSNNATTALINNLAAGIYFVTITDGGDCAFKDTAYVFEQPQLSFTLEPIASTCNNGSDGKCNILDVKIGNTPQPLSDFQFQWSTNPVQTGAVATQLNAGQVYNVTVTNDLGCTESKEFTVPNPDAISYEILRIQQSNCHDSNDGEVEIQGLGGTSPYTYLWDQGANSATTSSVVGLKPGRYNVSIADNNRCYTIAEINITAPAELVSNFEIEHVKCKGNKDAFAQVNVSGGVPNYSYIWSNGNTSSHNDKLLAGTYSVTIVDANGCTQIDSVAIVEPSTLPSATVLSENVSCYGASDGRITIQAIGGVYPYTYSTDGVNFNGLSSVLGLTAGVYTLFVKDHNGCLIELEPREILQPLPLLLDLGEDITISQESSITLEPTISNALSQITYGWSTTDSTTISCLTCPNPVVSPLFPQQYSLEITDANGCKDEDVIWIKIYKNLNVFVATGFTPNGDNENDQLFVQGKSEVKVNSFMVFDRWGENVFSSENATINDNTKGWDGNYRGKPCPPGLYLWKADVEFIDGTKLLFKGETSLIR